MLIGITSYLRSLRLNKNISQREMADVIGLSLRAFSDWETGKSEELKGSLLVKAVIYLNGSWEDIANIVKHDVEAIVAEEMAVNRLSSNNTLTVSDDEYSNLIRDLLIDVKLRNAFLVFWSGWKARDIST